MFKARTIPTARSIRFFIAKLFQQKKMTYSKGTNKIRSLANAKKFSMKLKQPRDIIQIS